MPDYSAVGCLFTRAEPGAAADRGPFCVSECFSSAKAAAAELGRSAAERQAPFAREGDLL